jgi:GTPase
VTGKNIDLLKSFFNLLNPRMENFSNDPAEFQIDDIYSVPGKIIFCKSSDLI